MTQDGSTNLALESYRTHQRHRLGLFASALFGSALFAIAYASWPAGQNKDFAEPVALAMTVVSLGFIMADAQISVNIVRASRLLDESSVKSVLREPVLRTSSAIFGVLAIMWSYLASVAAGGAELWGLIISGSAALLLWLLGAWHIRKAQAT